MSIRFKFRSSTVFDSVDLRGRRSISVRDLRDRIIAQKKLQICRDFDLLISDAETGKVFEDEKLEIAEGSSVVIKRVPAGLSSPLDLNIGKVERKDGGDVQRVSPAPFPAPAKIVDQENFDDFGIDLYPILQGSLPESDADIRNMKIADEKNIIPRCSDTSISKCQNMERSDLSEAAPKEVIGDNCDKENDAVETQKQTNLDSKKESQEKMNEYIGTTSPRTLDMDLPTELRCSLCNTIFKEAVMIPCCQHSFCEKCIRSTLLERRKCPKCSSMKCTVETLLPNLSLRQAIEHFLEAQAANNPVNKIPQDLPDVESGIHVREVSCAMSIRKKEPPFLHSPSGTGRGSNQLMADVVYENKLAGGTSKPAPLPLKMKQMMVDANSSEAALNHVASFHGSSKLPHNFLQEGDNMDAQKNKGHGVTVLDGSGNLMPSSRNRKGDRCCYMCGSPNHLIRDCPTASNSYTFNGNGEAAFAGSMPVYGQAYWPGNSYPQARPYGNMYAAPGMMHFDPTMPSMSPFTISPYMSSLYTGMPGAYGFMRMGGGQPPMTPGSEKPLFHQACVEPQDGKQKQKTSKADLERERDFNDLPEDCYHHKGSRTSSHERRHQLVKETVRSFSDDDSPRVHKKHSDVEHNGLSHRRPVVRLDEEAMAVERRRERAVPGRDQRSHHSEKSNSDVQDLSDSSNRHSRDRKRHHYESCLEKQSERRGQHKSDFSRKSQHQSRKNLSDDEKFLADPYKHSHRHHHHSESSLEPNFASGGRQHYKEKEASHSSKSSRHMLKSKDDRSEHERWEMVEGLNDDYRGVNYHKRRRNR